MTDSIRWVTAEQLCFEFEIQPRRLQALIRNGDIQGFALGGNPRHLANWRFIDPSEKYKAALLLREKIRVDFSKFDLMNFPLIGVNELADLIGRTPATVRNHIFKKKLKPHKLRRYCLFTPEQVRQFLLRRERKEPRSRRARCETILKWCLDKLHSPDDMTREEVDLDDHLESMLDALLRLKGPERTKAVAEFWRRYKVSKDVVAAIRAAVK